MKRINYNLVDPATLPHIEQKNIKADAASKSGDEQLKERLAKARELSAKQDEIRARRKATLEKQLDEAKSMCAKLEKVKGGAEMLAMVAAKIVDLEAQLLGSLEVAVDSKPAPTRAIDNRPTTIRVEAVPVECTKDMVS